MDWICAGLVADWRAIASVATAVIAGLAYIFARGEVKRRRFLRAGDAAMTLMNRGLSLVSSNLRISTMTKKGAPPEVIEREIEDWREGILLFNIDAQRLGVYFDDDSAEGFVVTEISKRFIRDVQTALKDSSRNSELAVGLRIELGAFVRGPNRKERAQIKKAGAAIKARHQQKYDQEKPEPGAMQ